MDFAPQNAQFSDRPSRYISLGRKQLANLGCVSLR